MPSSPHIRVAFGTVPKDSGTFTFYRNLRPVLAPLGVELLCLSAGREEARLWQSEYADAGCVQLVPRSGSIKTQARAVSDWCASEGIDIVLGINSIAILSALPHLPERVRVMARCANAFDHGYRITMSGRDRLMRVIAVSPRQCDDLVSGYGADPERLTLIPNGIDPAPFDRAAASPRGQGARLELGFVGRLEHGQKGVMHLPGIVEALDARGVPYRLRIAGKGIHEDRLKAALAGAVAAGRVEFLGALPPDAIPDFLAETDIYLFTSRFEGMPNALIEAMMAGAVPVCFNIEGITDFMIEDGRTGLLRPQEDCAGVAEAVARLQDERAGLGQMARAVAEAARARFSNRVAAQAYAKAYHEVAAEPPLPWTPRPWRDFKVDPNFPQTWRRFVPRSVKTLVKKARA